MAIKFPTDTTPIPSVEDTDILLVADDSDTDASKSITFSVLTNYIKSELQDLNVIVPAPTEEFQVLVANSLLEWVLSSNIDLGSY